jgi:hypothetical protein
MLFTSKDINDDVEEPSHCCRIVYGVHLMSDKLG